MRDPLAQLGQAAKSLFKYRSAARSGAGGFGASPSNTAWLFNAPWVASARQQKGIQSSSELTNSSIFIIALNFQIDGFCLAPPIVERWEKPDGLNPRWVPDYEHSAIRVLRYPNNVLKTGRQMFAGILTDLKVDANSYIAKEKNVLGEVTALHWAPWYQWEIVTEPGDEARGISYYLRHTGQGAPEKWMPEDIIHIKGPKPDPQDVRRGWNDSAAFFKEVSTDMQRAEFSFYILKNRAVASGIISPENSEDEWDEETAAKLGAAWMAGHGEENIGKLHVAGTPFKFQALGHNPQEMVIDMMAKIPESRIAGWFKFPPGVLHYLVGVERNTDNNAERAMEMAIEYGIMPLWDDIGEQITCQLLSEPIYGHRRRKGQDAFGNTIYGPMPLTVRVGFDKLDVRALQQDHFKMREAATNEWQWGGRLWKEYRAEIGLPPEGSERDNWVYTDFQGHAAGLAGSGMQATGGGKPQLPSGGGTADTPEGNVRAAMNDGQNSSKASK